MRVTILIFLSLLLQAEFVFAQSSEFKNQFAEAEILIQERDFNSAIEKLKPLVKKHPENANLQFKLGLCYLQTSYKKAQSIDYLKKAQKNTTRRYYPDNPREQAAPFETTFLLAQAYYHNHHFQKADSLFRHFKGKISDVASDEYLNELDRFITLNNNAKQQVNNAKDVKIVHLPAGINTPAIEYAPVISGDESTLIFTSNRGTDKEVDLSKSDDLYIVHKKSDKWGKPAAMDKINTQMHEASSSLSFDGSTLIIYINENGDGSLYQSNNLGNKWSQPVKMPDPINSRSLETHGCFTPDKKEFYFTSNRSGGEGGLDIYVTRKMPNGIWSAAKNLGSDINTPYDEDSPFMHPDDQRLYFSSDGHNSMGGLDIFVAKRTSNTEWSKPKNIGYPINSTVDDVCFSVSADGKRGYYASFNKKSLGETDLFMIEMPGEEHTNMVVYVGYAKNDKGEVIKDAEITAYDKETGEMFGVYAPNTRTGKFVLAAQKGKKLRLTIEAEGYKTIEKHIEVSSEEKEGEGTPEVPLEDIRMQNDWTIPGYIFMPYDSYETDMTEHHVLVEFLKAKPAVKIKLTGHTDSKGPQLYNKQLSQKRALFVKQYLNEHNIEKSRIKIEGKGEKEPVAFNTIDGEDCEKGRFYNRRVEITIIGPVHQYTTTKIEIPKKLMMNLPQKKRTDTLN